MICNTLFGVRVSVFLNIFLIFVFMAAFVVNSSHAVEFCYDNCKGEVAVCNQTSPDMGTHVVPIDTDQQQSHDHPVHQNRCCHHHICFSNHQEVLLLDSLNLLVGVSPKSLVSDPHARGPFQPPKV